MSSIQDFSIRDNGVLFHYSGSDTDVVIPEGVRRIDHRAFSDCPKLASITLPPSVCFIMSSSFDDCENFKKIFISDLSAFMKIGYYSLTMWSSGLLYGRELFLNGELVEDLKIPDDMEETGSMLRDYNGLRSVVIPESVVNISKDAFSRCRNLKKVVITDKLKGIYYDAFSGCEDVTLHIPHSEFYRGMPVSWKDMFYTIHIENQPITHYEIESGATEIKKFQFTGLSQLESIEIPDTVISIGEKAFSGCTGIGELKLPENLNVIDRCAFMNCTGLKNLTIPSSVTKIGEKAFSGCASIRELELPENLKVIDRCAFVNCSGLKKLTIPSSVTEIGEYIVAHCDNLTEVCIKSFAEKIDRKAFSECDSLVVHFEEKMLATKDKLPAVLCYINFAASDEELAYIFMYQKTKTWREWTATKKLNNPDLVLENMIKICDSEKKPPLDMLSGFIADRLRELSPEQIRKAVGILEKKKYKDLNALKELPEIGIILSGKTVEENPIEAIVRERSAKSPILPEVLEKIKKGIPYAGSKQVSSREAVAFILSEYAKEWRRCSGEVTFPRYDTSAEGIPDGMKIEILAEADEIAEALDRDALQSLVADLAGGIHYRPWLLAWARYADDRQVQIWTSYYKTEIKGKASEFYKAYSMRECLLINDTIAAVQFFDRIGDLDRYAEMRGKTAMELRDTVMLPDFEFDCREIKSFDTGDTVIEVSITPDLGFKLYDTKAQKEIRSFPKKGGDQKKLDEESVKFKEFKDAVIDFAKARTKLIHKMHISGEYISRDNWERVYLKHPVIRHLTQLLIWQDKKGNTFTVVDGAIVDAQGETFVPDGDIRVAHVMDMKGSEIKIWQQKLAGSGRKQLFDQIWEPIVKYDKKIDTRYSGAVITYQDRNALKKALKQRGIEAGSGDMAFDYNHRAGSFSFTNEGKMKIGKCLEINYHTDPDKKVLTLERTWLWNSEEVRELNADLLELDKIVISAQIANDNDSALTEYVLSDFTAAQITAFLDQAIKSKATKSTAVLLDYKNRHFPEYADINEFSLDW